MKGYSPEKPVPLEEPLFLLYAKLAGSPFIEIDLKDPVGTHFGRMVIKYSSREFNRVGAASTLVVSVTLIAILLVIAGLYARRLSEIEVPFLSLFKSIRGMKSASEGTTEKIHLRLERAAINTGILEMDLLQKEFAAALASLVVLQEELNDAKVTTAIARTTQALAHDVRKPLSMSC